MMQSNNDELKLAFDNEYKVRIYTFRILEFIVQKTKMGEKLSYFIESERRISIFGTD